ncbi:MAG: GMC family oxidoreductase [Bacteroidetes bacterium]|nr:GMC family oxidoreductase [Bacteroidota bacterium]
MELKESYDYIIIGSGFGGSVSALRLAEKGYSVLIIEKGKKYSCTDFPETNWNVRKWFWVPRIKLFGIQKLTFFRHITILSGIGVGGGSLVYANTLPKPKSAFFNQGSWAGLENWESELAPFYETASKMLGAAENPLLAESDLALQKLAQQINRSGCFAPTTAGVFFGEPDKTVKDPYFNGKGPERKGCIHCGACMTGCRQNAKNSLDKNYLYLAQDLGVEILPEHEVTEVKPIGERGEKGYAVTFRQSTKYFSRKNKITSNGVIFSGGVLGTVPLLLKLRKSTLPFLSPRVGDMIRSNNEALIVNTTINKNPELHKGLAIGSILELDENSHLEPVRYGEGSGFWRITMMPMVSEPNFFKRIIKLIILLFKYPITWLKILFVRDYAKSSSILLFMQHLESTLKLRRGVFGTNTRVEKGKAPTPFIPEAHSIAQAYSKIINGKPQVIMTETITGIPSTAHILGGSCMGKTKEDGVIDSNNHVFGYENMYVFDGSVISANPGVNPALTITAISERGISKIQSAKSKMQN